MPILNMDEIRDIKHKQMDEFLRQIDEPERYTCSVIGYMRGHGLMAVEARKILQDTNVDHVFYLCFEAVMYFEGPLRWEGVDFRLASLDERKELVRKAVIDVGEFINNITGRLLLLILERPLYRVQILAGNCEIGEKIPPIFHAS